MNSLTSVPRWIRPALFCYTLAVLICAFVWRDVFLAKPYLFLVVVAAISLPLLYIYEKRLRRSPK